MAKKRIRIDMEDADGARYDIKLEGNVTREKVLKIFEMMDLMNIEEEQETTNMDSTGSKIWHIVDKFFPMGKVLSLHICLDFLQKVRLIGLELVVNGHTKP